MADVWRWTAGERSGVVVDPAAMAIVGISVRVDGPRLDSVAYLHGAASMAKRSTGRRRAAAQLQAVVDAFVEHGSVTFHPPEPTGTEGGQ